MSKVTDKKLFMCETCVGNCWPQYMFMYWTVSSARFPATFCTMQDGLPLIASLLPSALPLGFSLCISGRCFPKLQHHCNSARGQKDSAYLDQCPVHTPSVRNSTLLGSVSGSHPLWKGLYLAWISIRFTRTSVRGSALVRPVSGSHSLCTWWKSCGCVLATLSVIVLPWQCNSIQFNL